ncbi:MAG: fliC [Vampirovibrio sp.]|jgi:flagellin|nr:fliC [Vampirovibrio sp.]
MSSLVVNTNVSSLIAQRRLTANTQTLQKSLERLASGYRINRAADDAAGLTISQNLVSQIRKMQQASKNTQDGISVLQTAEGSLEVMGENLQRVRELTVQAANDTNDATGRIAINTEIRALLSDIDRIAAASNLNGIKLLDGSATNAVIQIGPNSNAVTNTVDLSSVLVDSSTTALGAVGGSATFANVAAVDLSTSAAASAFLSDLDNALRTLNTQRSNIGSLQNKLESVSGNLSQGIQNFAASNSRIRDVDVAAETSTMAQYQVLTQAATSVLSQTNNLPRMILNMLKAE